MTTRVAQRTNTPKIDSTIGISLQRFTGATARAPLPTEDPEVLEIIVEEVLKDAPWLLRFLRIIVRFAGWAGVAYLLFHSEEAGSFGDEVNPITGLAYASKEEREAVKALSSSEIKDRIRDARRSRCEELHARYDKLSKQLNKDAASGARSAKCDKTMSEEELRETLDALREIEPLRRQLVESKCDDVLEGSLEKKSKGLDPERGHQDQVDDYQIRIKDCYDLLNIRKGGIKPKLPQPTSSKVVQAKLTVNSPGDKYEQEADRVADQVMRMPEPTVQRQCACGKSSTDGECSECKKKKDVATRSLQRVANSPVGGIVAPPIVNNVLSSAGSPLPTATRSFMESRFGQDFSHVRVHTDQRAVESASAVQARAYTVGNNIVFGHGESPSRDHHLLAHELTHVVQQSGAERPGEYMRNAPATVQRAHLEKVHTIRYCQRDDSTEPVMCNNERRHARSHKGWSESIEQGGVVVVLDDGEESANWVVDSSVLQWRDDRSLIVLRIVELPLSCIEATQHFVQNAGLASDWEQGANDSESRPYDTNVTFGGHGCPLNLTRDDIPSMVGQRTTIASTQESANVGEGLMALVPSRAQETLHAVAIVGTSRAGQLIVLERNAGTTSGSTAFRNDQWFVNIYDGVEGFRKSLGEEFVVGKITRQSREVL